MAITAAVCDSFAMEMDFRLKTAGIQLADRRLAMCSMSRREIDHCALVLNAEDGWMVSECNSQHIVSLDDLPYTMWYLAPENGQITEEWVCL